MDPITGGALLSGLAGAAGMIGQGPKRKWKYAKRMASLELKNQKELNTFNKQLAMEMWRDTNYSAQVSELKKAGLSTGLLYDMPGQGGSTNTGAGTDAGDAKMPDWQNQNTMAIQTALAVALQKSVIDKTKAETKQIQVNTDKTAGVDTEQVKSGTEKLKQEVISEKMKQEIMRWEKELKRIETETRNSTQGDVIKQTKEAAKKMEAEATEAAAKGEISQATKDDIIKQTKQATTEQNLRISAQQKGLTLQDEQIRKVGHEILRMTTQSDIDWGKLDQERQNTEIRKLIQQHITSDAAKLRQWTEVIMPITRAVME